MLIPYHINMIDPVALEQGIALSSRHIARETPNFSDWIDTAIIGKPRGVIALVKNLRSNFLLKKNATTGLSQRELSELEKIQKEDMRFNKQLEVYNQAKRQGEFERKNNEAKDKECKLRENQKKYTDLGTLPAVQEIAFFENDVYNQIRKQVVNENDKLGLEDEQAINAETIKRMEEIINQLSINFVKGRALPIVNKIFLKKVLKEIESFKATE